MTASFQQLAAYNRWANGRLYEAALALGEADYRRDVGAFFKSLHGTLNHLLVADRIWFRRLTGEGDPPARLDAILYEDRGALVRARAAEDERIIRVVSGYDDAALQGTIRYSNSTGAIFQQRVADVLAHVFNHQTHHRGQAHTILSIVTGKEPPPLDLLAYQRNLPAPDLRTLAGSAPAARNPAGGC